MIRNLGVHACEEHSGKREGAYLVDIFSLQDRQPYPCLREITLQGVVVSHPLHLITLVCTAYRSSFWKEQSKKGTVHRQTAAYPAGNPLRLQQGVPYTPTCLGHIALYSFLWSL